MHTNNHLKAFRRKTAILSCLTALSVAGCDQFLEPKPTDVLAPENFYRSAADAVSAVNSVYSQSQWVYFWIWYESDVASDDIFATPNYGADGHQLASYTFDPTLWSIDDLWTNAYITINKANIVLDRVPPIEMDVTERNRVLGEAHYLRALMYFQLVRMFGDVPLMEHEAKSVADAKIARTPAAQVYALIVSDLQTAMTDLSPSYSGADLGRATSGAATSLLAKVYLNQKDYNNAAKFAGQVMSSGQYSLNARWLDNFKISDEFVNPESIFEINYGAPEQTPGVVGSVQTLFSLPSGFPGGDAYGLMQVNPDLIALYSANDQRGNGATYMTSPYVTALGDTATWGVPNGAAFHKWLDETDSKDMTARSWQQMPNNWIIQRYADVVLIYAEAVNSGGTAINGPAEAALNQVRARAGIPAVSGLGAAALTDSIRVERRREFAFEGQRWFDLSRWGILDAIVKAKTQQMQTLFPGETLVHGAPSNLFPIPNGQINSNALLTQNPGW
ncbi:MAG TPA: RagB/SusD family nutrient uptake outer membrane protein [Gemmatimonadaceae bacterium]